MSKISPNSSIFADIDIVEIEISFLFSFVEQNFVFGSEIVFQPRLWIELHRDHQRSMTFDEPLFIFSYLNFCSVRFHFLTGTTCQFWHLKLGNSEESSFDALDRSANQPPTLTTLHSLDSGCDQCDQKKIAKCLIKVAQKWFRWKTDRFWQLYKNCLRMWEIWAN